MTGAPIELGRDEARRLARQELADPAYDTEPPLLQQVIERILREFTDLVDNAAGSLGNVGGLVVLALVAGVVGIVLLRYRPLARRAAIHPDAVFGDERRSAASHRAAADAAHAKQDWKTSVIERYRAIVASLEERAVLEPRAGRTADEAASDAGPAFPDLAGDLASAATIFNSIKYGGRDPREADAALLRHVDQAIAAARIQHGEAVNGPTLAVPQ